jgi:hypothetical protein
LLENTPAQIGVKPTRLYLVHGFPQFIIGYAFLSGKAGEPHILEYPH